jgi:hypothetical protein
MVTVMPIPQVLDDSGESSLLLWRLDSRRLACNDLVRTCKQSVFVPLCTVASLPALAANVAELGPASASTEVSSDPRIRQED